jgi:hypothetical protein
MRRVFSSLVFVLVWGAAMAQPPVDYTLVCDDEVVGTASYVDGELHVAWSEGVTCEGTLSVAQDSDLIVAIDTDADGRTTVTITDVDGSVSGVAEELPQVAVDGMATAQENRAEAGTDADEAAEAAAEGEASASDRAEEAADRAAAGIGNADDAAEPGAEHADDAASEGEANAREDAEEGADRAAAGNGNADDAAESGAEHADDAAGEERGAADGEADVDTDEPAGGAPEDAERGRP